MSDGENRLDVFDEQGNVIGELHRKEANGAPEVSEASRQSLEAVISVVEWLQVRNGGVFEDWGCGFASPTGPWVKHLVNKMQYVGIDRSAGPGVSIVADLVHRRSDADVIFMHHVLGTSGHWRIILDNALHSFRMRMAIVESGRLIPSAELIQVIQTHAWPHKHTVLPDGRDLYTITRIGQ